MTLRTAMTAAAVAALFAGGAQAQSAIETEGASFDGNTVTFSNVTAESPGYLVVTEDIPEGATASDPIAQTEVEEGDNENVILEGDFSPGVVYIVRLHAEGNDEDGFQWGEDIDMSDPPAMNDGQPVETSFEIMVESGDSQNGSESGSDDGSDSESGDETEDDASDEDGSDGGESENNSSDDG